MAAAVPQLNFGPEVTYIFAAILIITGLALAFYGHGLWTTVMSMIGALLGSAAGFLVGAALGGIVAGLVLALVGAVIGSILFTKLVKVALAFLVGLLAGALAYGLLGGSASFTEGRLDTALIGALLVLIVVFAISYYFIDDIIGIITAAIGGLLLRLRLYTAIAIESRGGLHRARHRARHGPGPGAPGDLAARPHDLRAHPGPDPRFLRRGQGHPDRQRLRLRVPPDDPPLRARGHGRPRGRIGRRREFGGPARHGRPREAGRAHAGGDPAPGARGPGLHLPSDDNNNIGHAG